MSATQNIYGMRLSVSFTDADNQVQTKTQSIGKLIANHTCVFTWDLENNGITAELVISADIIDQADVDLIKSQTSFYSIPNALSSRFAVTKSLNPFLKPKNELVNNSNEVKMSSSLTQKIKSLFSRDTAPVAESTVVAVSSTPVVAPVVPAPVVEERIWVCPFTTISEDFVLIHDHKLVVSKRTSAGVQSVIEMAIAMNTRSANEGLEKAVELLWDDNHQIFTHVGNIPNANGYRFLTEAEWLSLVGDATPEYHFGSQKRYSSNPTDINQYGLSNMLGDTWDVVIGADGFLAKGGSRNNLRKDCNVSYSVSTNIYEKKNFGFRFCRNA